MTELSTTFRKPSTAAVLSMFCTGLGHIYCGRFVAGLALNFVTLTLIPVAMTVALLPDRGASLTFFVLACLFVLSVYIYAIVASYRLAKRIGGNYQLRDYNRGVVYLLFIAASLVDVPAVALHIRSNVLQAFACPGDSMAPTLLKGDRFLVNKLVQRRTPDRGDIVVFLRPDNRDVYYVKRVIALPGDRVSLDGDEVVVNGQKLRHQAIAPGEPAAAQVMYETNGSATYRIQVDGGAAKTGGRTEMTVPPGHCFVLGDNRDHTEDSRRFGVVPLGDIAGRAQHIYWPPSRWSRIGAID